MSSTSVATGWELCRFDDVARIVRGITFPTDAKSHRPAEGMVACLRTANVQTSVEWGDLWFVPRKYVKSDEQYVRDGDVLISTANSYELVGKVARIQGIAQETSLGAFISLLRTEHGISDVYFYYLMSSERVQRAIRAMASTTTNLSNVSGGKLKELFLPIAPEGEQTRIVEKLEELLSDLDAGAAELKTAQRKLTQYRQSLLKAAVEGTLTANWRAARVEPQETGADLLQRILAERRGRWESKQLAKFAEQGKAPPKGWKAKYPEPVAPDTRSLPALPERWTWASIDQCALDDDAITDGPFGSNLKSSHYTEDGPRVLRLQNIGDGHFVDSRAYISQSHYDSLGKHAVTDGDLVVAMLGEVLPRACVIPAGVAPAIVKADCARIRLNIELLVPEVLNAILNSEPTRKRVARLVKGIGRPRVNLGSLRTVTVPLPPRQEQIAIQNSLVDALEACDQQNIALDTGFRLAAAQRKNILKAAFAGQLVPQDPNDEPASALLARIRAERAGADATPARKRGRKAKESI